MVKTRQTDSSTCRLEVTAAVSMAQCEMIPYQCQQSRQTCFPAERTQADTKVIPNQNVIAQAKSEPALERFPQAADIKFPGGTRHVNKKESGLWCLQVQALCIYTQRDIRFTSQPRGGRS